MSDANVNTLKLKDVLILVLLFNPEEVKTNEIDNLGFIPCLTHKGVNEQEKYLDCEVMSDFAANDALCNVCVYDSLLILFLSFCFHCVKSAAGEP